MVNCSILSINFSASIEWSPIDSNLVLLSSIIDLPAFRPSQRMNAANTSLINLWSDSEWTVVIPTSKILIFLKYKSQWNILSVTRKERKKNPKQRCVIHKQTYTNLRSSVTKTLPSFQEQSMAYEWIKLMISKGCKRISISNNSQTNLHVLQLCCHLPGWRSPWVKLSWCRVFKII